MKLAVQAVGAALGVLATAVVLAAQPVAEASPARFDVFGFAIEGRSLLKGEDFTVIVAPFTGRNKTAADIERARGALQQAYQDLGHCTVRVSVPRAEPRDGVVTFVISDAPGQAVANCLPAIALNGAARPAPVEPAVRVAAAAGNEKSDTASG